MQHCYYFLNTTLCTVNFRLQNPTFVSRPSDMARLAVQHSTFTARQPASLRFSVNQYQINNSPEICYSADHSHRIALCASWFLDRVTKVATMDSANAKNTLKRVAQQLLQLADQSGETIMLLIF